MSEHSTASIGGDISGRLAAMADSLAKRLAEIGDIDIRGVISSSGLRLEPWSCEMIVLGDATQEPADEERAKQAAAASIRLVSQAFEECGGLLLEVDRNRLPACVAKPLNEHADDPAAACLAAVVRMHDRYPEHAIGIERGRDASAVFLFPAVAKLIATLKAIGSELREAPAIPVASDDHRRAFTPRADVDEGGRPSAADDATLPPRSKAEVIALLRKVEESVRSQAKVAASRDGLSAVEAAAEAEEKASELRNTRYKKMWARLETEGWLRPSERRGLEGDTHGRFGKQIEAALKSRELAWQSAEPDESRREIRTVSDGQAAELLGSGASRKLRRQHREGLEKEACTNCGIFDVDEYAGDSVTRHFCESCGGRHSHSTLEAILNGSRPPESDKLSKRELFNLRQVAVPKSRRG
jgi:hypothetical protein